LSTEYASTLYVSYFTRFFSVPIAKETHPFPFRTRQLRPFAAMVLQDSPVGE
jgi:hypothetical protein